MTKSTITRERLAKIKSWSETYGAGSNVMLPAEEAEALALIALAAMDGEPVAYSLIFRNMDGALNNYINTNTTFSTREKAEAYGKGGSYEVRSDGRLEWVPNPALDPVVVPLYRHAQPVPVVPVVPDVMEPTIEAIKRILPTSNPDEYAACIGADMWNACLAAMLQTSPVCTCPSGDGSLRWPCSVHPGNSPAIPDCWCRTCRSVVLNDMRFVVCPDCGNKRCPRANDHRNSCTGSNEPGQEGSAYPDTPREVKP